MRCLLLFVVHVPLLVFAQRSPYNGLTIPTEPDSTGVYRIIIGGHFHGESTNASGFPAATLLANLDTLNAMGARLFLSTGDLFMDPDPKKGDLERYRRSLFSQLNMPFFNAPGNHDVAGTGDAFAHGTPAAFTVTDSRIILLNSEAKEGSLGEDELRMLDEAEAGATAKDLRRVMLVGHRPIWAENDPEYANVFKGFTRSVTGTNYEQDVLPRLQRIAAHVPVLWISGSLGGSAPASIFFQEHAPNITFIQCAIRDQARDALLIADLTTDSIRWNMLSLTGKVSVPPQTFTKAWWLDHRRVSGEFNWRLLPYLIRSTVTHRAFWWGAGLCLLAMLFIRRLIRR